MRRSIQLLWFFVILAAPVVFGSDTVEPIFLVGADGISTIEERFPGAGTEVDPYRITSLEIDAGGADYGIWIENIDLWLVLDGIEVYGAQSPGAQGGIVLRNCANTSVQESYVHDNRVGIRMTHCTGIRVEGNVVSDNTYGIVLDLLSQDNTIIGNRFKNDFNAQARSPNTWSDAVSGNCWSDASGDQYQISSGNIDTHASSFESCPALLDHSPPVIRAWGNAPLEIAIGDSVLEAIGALVQATDEKDGAVPLAISFPSGSEPESLGLSEVKFEACDLSGNCISLVRTVNIVDRMAPSVSILGPNPLQVAVGTALPLDPGARGVDKYEGEVAIDADWSSVDLQRVGTYEARYTACDSSANCATALRTIEVLDTQPPTIQVLGPDPLVIEAGAASHEDPGARGVDKYEGQLEALADWSGVDLQRVGTYEVRYTACDSSANCATALRTIEVLDTQPPTIQVLGPDPLVIEAGAASHEDPGAYGIDSYDGQLEALADWSQVRTGTPGRFVVQYSSCDSSGNCVSSKRSVQVVDTTPPTLTLNPPQTLVIAVGEDVAMTDPGVAVHDAVDERAYETLTSDYSHVSADEPGVYEISYVASDRYGNRSAPITRTVLVGLPDWEDSSSVWPVSSRLTRWRKSADAIQAQLRFSTAGDVSVSALQVYAFDVLSRLIRSLPDGLQSRFSFSTELDGTQWIAGQIEAKSLALARRSDWPELISLFTLEPKSSGPGSFLTGSVSSLEEARDRAESAAAYSLRGTTGTALQVLPVLFGNETGYSVTLSYGVMLDEDKASGAGETIPSQARAVALAIRAVLPQSQVTVAVYANYYGLVYRGGLKSQSTGAPPEWNELYVHPVLDEAP